MVNIKFLGVGSDLEKNPTSILINEKDSYLLLDATPSIFSQLSQEEISNIDMVFISHSHAAHFIGLPMLIAYYCFIKKRKRALTVFIQKKNINKLKNLLKIMYNINITSLPFNLNFIELRANLNFKFDIFDFYVGRTMHTVDNHFLKIYVKEKSLLYTGDGKYIHSYLKPYEYTDIILQNILSFNKKNEYAMNLKDSIKFYSQFDYIKEIYFLHLLDYKQEVLNEYVSKLKDLKFKIHFPKDNDIITL